MKKKKLHHNLLEEIKKVEAYNATLKNDSTNTNNKKFK